MTSLSVCVFGGSAEPLQAAVYVQAARELGEQIGRRGHRLVYGGTPVGLIGVLAHGVQAAGGSTLGVVPSRLLGLASADELIVTETMRDRKATMDRHADTFVVLPGGFGTLEEALEVITLWLLGLHQRPVVLLNVGGYYDPFLAMVSAMIKQGFATEGQGHLFQVATCPAAALDLAEALPGRAAGVPPVRARTAGEAWTAAPGDPTPPDPEATVER